MSSVRHADHQIEMYRLFPRLELMKAVSGPLCETAEASPKFARKWDRVTCPNCLGDLGYKRASEIHQKLGFRTIPVMKCYIVAKLDWEHRPFSESELEVLESHPFLPARYYIYFEADSSWVHLEAWGSAQPGDADRYFRALEAESLPYRLFKFLDEPTSKISVTTIDTVNLRTGETDRSYVVQPRGRQRDDGRTSIDIDGETS